MIYEIENTWHKLGDPPTVHDWLIGHREYRPIASRRVHVIGPFATYKVITDSVNRAGSHILERKRVILWVGASRP